MKTIFDQIRRDAELKQLEKVQNKQLEKAVWDAVEALRNDWETKPEEFEEWYDLKAMQGVNYVACEILQAGDDAVEKATRKLYEFLTEKPEA